VYKEKIVNATELLAAREQAKQDKEVADQAIVDRIAELRAELEALGAKRVRKPKAEKKGPGRPRGSKNKKDQTAGYMEAISGQGVTRGGE
jgi:hypothetical protein